MLSYCLQCGEKVSTQAFACPHCGQASPTDTTVKPLIPPDTRILRSDPRAAEKWEEIRVKLRTVETARKQNKAILQAVAREGERQAEMLDLIRDRAWQVFTSAGCPHCRVHSVKRMNGARRVRLFFRGRLFSLFRKRYCDVCGHAW